MTIAVYLTAAIIAWSHIATERATSIASDIAEVVESEPPLWSSPVKTALVVASIAKHESEFAQWVEDGRCNDPEWRKSTEGLRLLRKKGDCDSGHAYGLGQMHVAPAVLLVDGDAGWVLLRHPEEGAITPKDVIADRKLAFKVELHMLRRSIQARLGLCGYTGEVERPCPKGEKRLETAVTWYKAHPFSP
jgi:hypothetical protein